MNTRIPSARINLDDFELVDSPTSSSPVDVADPAAYWTPALVPGGVHETLLRSGAIEHPYVDRNEESVRWIEDRDWWYRTTFASPPMTERGGTVRLVFHGLDTVADIWLNGEMLGHHENMFRPADYDITALLRASNELLVRFSPPLADLSPVPASVDQLLGVASSLFPGVEVDEQSVGALAPSPEMIVASQRRKAMFSWGWDFGPRVPSIGIWRPVELIVSPGARITSHHVRTDSINVADETVQVTVTVEAESGDDEVRAEIRLTSPSGRVHEATTPVMDGVAAVELTLEEAELWWTHDLGDPALYDVQIALVGRDGVHDAATDRVGLRTIALNRAPDAEGGRRFQFVLNGVPIFARGANWLPASMMVGSVSAERHRSLMSLARNGGMNMLRVWGGGIYELDSFYAAADELGVLIWQDFMFACADYPSDDDSLRREVELEADYQVRRLRNRACIALWSGNNETHMLHGLAYQQFEPGNWGWDFFHRILPDTVERLDPTTPYWPGSPWGEDPREGFMGINGVLDGDRHAWEVWHGFDAGADGDEEYATIGEARHFRRYRHDHGRFISEFGIHASPSLATLERWIPKADLSIHSPSFDAHNKDHPKDKGDALLEIITGLPTTIEEYVDFTMVSQAEGMKFGIEHYRRRQPICNGTLVWQFNDVWPGFTWSLIDHDTVPKAAYYHAARAYAPLITSFTYDNGELSLWASNAGRHAVSTEATVSLRDFDGSVSFEETVPIEVGPADSKRVWSRTVESSADAYAWVSSMDDQIPDNRLFFGEIKDLPFPPSELSVTVTETSASTADVTVTADAFSYLVRVTSSHAQARFSDNFIDMIPGQSRTIRVSGLPTGFDSAELLVGSYIGAHR